MSSTRTSALSRSALSSSSTLSSTILGAVNILVICSKPAYEKVLLKATPSTSTDSCSAPPGTFFMPIMSTPRGEPSTWLGFGSGLGLGSGSGQVIVGVRAVQG